MKRRRMLGLLAACALPLPAAARTTASAGPRRLLVSIRGIGHRTDPARLSAVLDLLTAAMIPASLIPAAGDDSVDPQANAEIFALVSNYARRFPGLIGLAARCGRLGGLPPYDIARQGFLARQALHRLMPEAPPFCTVLACSGPFAEGDAAALSGAGFRTLLVLPAAAAPVRVTGGPGAVLVVTGGEPLGFADAGAVFARRHLGQYRHLVFSAPETGTETPAAIVAGLSAFSHQLREETTSARRVSLLANEVALRNHAGFRRRLALHLFEPDPRLEGDAAALEAFARMLTRAAIPYSKGPDLPLSDTAERPTALCWMELTSPGIRQPSPSRLSRLDQNGADEATGWRLKAGAGEGIPIGLASAKADSFGLNARAIQMLPVLLSVRTEAVSAEVLATDVPLACEGVITVSPAAVRSDFARAALLRMIGKLRVLPGNHLTTLPALAADLLPRDPFLPTVLRARSLRLRAGTEAGWPDRLREGDAHDLMEDARAAWSYFSGLTNRRTGLCPATVQTGGGAGAVQDRLTMWEAGSHINALMAAADLGLIAEEEFSARCNRLLKTLSRAANGPLRLPPETISSSTGKGSSRFNAFDTGRLLLALDRLRRYRLAPADVAALVASWDFSTILRQRHLHSWRDGAFVDEYRSNYSDYVAVGFRRWAYDVVSPFDSLRLQDSADQQIALLRLVEQFGPLGIEPAFLHLLEIGPDHCALTLADCLSALLRDAAAEYGHPVAPSESPVNQVPWFTYQGFRLRAGPDPWMVTAGFADTTVYDSGFLARLRATSSKAAYLLHAVRPDTDSAKLTALVRQKARREGGFDSAIFVADGQSTAGYTDLNTNAVILTAICRILADQY